MSRLIVKGNIVYTKDRNELTVLERGCIVVEDGIIVSTYASGDMPDEYKNNDDTEYEDYGDRLIIPGMIDLHVHAPQYSFIGVGMDLELLDWLNTHTFPEERRYFDASYASKAYAYFVRALVGSTTTRAVIFATIHKDSTILLMDMLERSGIMTMVGKINMDRNSPDYYIEDTYKSINDTRDYIDISIDRYKYTKPIITPRFVPSCTMDLMRELGDLSVQYNMGVQSHLSENVSEIEWVAELEPDCESYTDCYVRSGLIDSRGRTIMAHCVYLSNEEQEVLKSQGVYVAHCPSSNTNLSSGIAPIRTYIDKGIRVGLGSDVAGGSNISIMRAMADAISVSKLRWRIMDNESKSLTLSEALYMATKGGGEYFGKVGSFEDGYEADIVVLDDSNISTAYKLGIEDRLERLVYLGDDRNVYAKYVQGRRVNI